MLRQLLCIIFLGFGLLLSAQDTSCSTGLVLKSVEAVTGDTVTVDVTTYNVSTIVGLQYNHSWNPGILDFVEVLYPSGSPVNVSNFNLSPTLTNTGFLNFVYVDNNLSGMGLDDGDVLYQLRFVYLGGGTSTVSTNGDHIDVEIIDNNATIVDNFYLMHATVGPLQMQVPPFDAYPYPDGVCMEGQVCNDPDLGRISLTLSDNQISGYDWTGPGGYTASGTTITGLASGVYQLMLTHNSGRTSTGNFYVGQLSSLNLTLSVDADECGGTPDGAVFTAITGGSGSYTYAWSNGATTSQLNNLLAGEYTVTVTDVDGNCSVSASTTVASNAPFSVWYTAISASCDGSADGAVTVNSDATGDALPLTYQWSNGSTSQTATGLVSDFYAVTITGANGCSQTIALFLAEDTFAFDATVTNSNCSGGSGGSIAIPLSTTTYDFSWSTGASGTNTLTDLTAGSYSVTVTDLSSGCSASQTYEVNGEIIAAVSIDCYQETGLDLVDISAIVWNNDDGPYTFAWSNGTNDTAQQISSITLSENGTYSVTITSASGCTSVMDNIEVTCIGEANVNLHFNPALSNMNTGDTRCFEVLADGFTDIAGMQFTLSWDPSALNFLNLGAFNLPVMTASNFGVELTANGKLSVSWLSSNSSGESLPDDSPLFEVCFEAIGLETANTTINISSFPTEIEFTNSDLEQLAVSQQSAIVYLNGGSSGGTGDFEVTTASALVMVGNTVCVPVSIGEINDLIGFQFALAWDPDALQYTGVQSLNLPSLSTGNFGTLAEGQNDGRLRVIWSDFTLGGISLAQETVAFEVCFLAVGEEGTYPIVYDNDLLPVEGVNASFEYLSTALTGGEITISDDSNPGTVTSLKINSVAVAPDESVCLPVEVVNFEDIVGMQFSISWDDELLNFDGIEIAEELNLLANNDFNILPSGNSLACAWIDSDVMARTLAPGTVIFELCFTAASQEGTAGVIFSNQPTAIEFVQNNQIVPFLPVNGEITISGDGLIWPGDLNNDGTANNMDGLHLGLAYGATGPERNNASINWQAQYAALWMAETPETHTNYRHIDANGNGLIDAVDTLALSQNWAQNTDGFTDGGENGGGQQGFTGAPIYLQEQTVQAGARVRIPIMLGTEENQVEGAYGVAFTIAYETEMVKTGSPQILYNGWLGGENGNLIGMYREFPALGQIEVVMVRTDGQNIDGSGQLAELSIIMEDVIIRSFTEVDIEVDFRIENVRLISFEEIELITSPRTSTILVEGVTIADEPQELQAITLSPNPTTNFVRIAHEGVILEQVSLQGAKGRMLANFQEKQEQLDLSSYPAGIYFLRIQTDKGITHRKVVKH